MLCEAIQVVINFLLEIINVDDVQSETGEKAMEDRGLIISHQMLLPPGNSISKGDFKVEIKYHIIK